tara:strand:+ start:289 stop:495 length:207 start_codon:yes stop_codon:yes gene_type:complete
MKYKQKYKAMPIDKNWLDPKKIHYFIGEVSDLAFGDEAIERGYGMEEVIEQLKEFSDNALKWEEGEEC